MHPLVVVLLLLAVSAVAIHTACARRRPRGKVPVSVNYHFTRRCNKACGFCFHTATTSHIEPLDRAKAALRLLQQSGMRKINFAGGEPFLYPQFLGALLVFCKEELHLESTSVVTNGSKVRERFLNEYGCYLDILAVSCDSFDEATNIAIGRGDGNQVAQLYAIARWCRAAGVRFKLNTVVNRLNVDEDMNAHIARLQPFRWKCFQVLIVDGENHSSTETLRNGHAFTISDSAFEQFCVRHRAQACLVPEPNRLMAQSYLILDEYLRFLDRNGRAPSAPIVDVGVQPALASVFWDEAAFLERGGVYDWKKSGCATEKASELKW